MSPIQIARLLIMPLLGAVLLLSTAAGAHDRFRPRNPDQLPVGTTSEKAYKITGAHIVYVNYEALLRDFPELNGKSHPQIDQWILDTKAFVAESQSKLVGIRTSEIPFDKTQSKRIYRTPTFNRAAYLEGLDLKGVGIHPNSSTIQEQISAYNRHKNNPEELNKLRTQDHSDGSMSLGEALVELYQQESVQRLFDRENAKHATDSDYQWLETLETYFILALPFDILKTGDHKDRAALYARQEGYGRRSGGYAPRNIVYNPAPGHATGRDRIRSWIQQTNSGAVVDFGATLITDPEVLVHHEYRDYTPEKVAKNEYIDSHNSRLYSDAYDLANALAHKTDPWEEKRKWVEKQMETHVAKKPDSVPTPTGEYLQLARLFEKSQKDLLNDEDFRQLVTYINRETHHHNDLLALRLQLILSTLTPETALKLVAFENKSNPVAGALSTLLDQIVAELFNHLVGDDTSIAPPMSSFLAALLTEGDYREQRTAIENLRQQIRKDKDSFKIAPSRELARRFQNILKGMHSEQKAIAKNYFDVNFSLNESTASNLPLPTDENRHSGVSDNQKDALQFYDYCVQKQIHRISDTYQ